MLTSHDAGSPFYIMMTIVFTTSAGLSDPAADLYRLTFILQLNVCAAVTS